MGKSVLVPSADVSSSNGEPAVGPIPRTRLVDKAVEVLRRAILGGGLPPGSRLRQLALAEQLGISRTPLREALAKLELEGLVTLLPAGGVRVARLEPAEAIELYDLREVLDGLAARLAAGRAAAAALAALGDHQEAMRECLATQDAHAWFTHHVAFHEGIFEAAGNARLRNLAPIVQQSVQRFHRLLLTTPRRLHVAFEEHEAILRALAGRDAAEAERLARQHIANARLIVARLVEEPSAEGGRP